MKETKQASAPGVREWAISRGLTLKEKKTIFIFALFCLKFLSDIQVDVFSSDWR